MLDAFPLWQLLKAFEKKNINLYVNDLHFVCKIRWLPLTVVVYLIYLTTGALSVLSKGC